MCPKLWRIEAKVSGAQLAPFSMSAKNKLPVSAWNDTCYVLSRNWNHAHSATMMSQLSVQRAVLFSLFDVLPTHLRGPWLQNTVGICTTSRDGCDRVQPYSCM